MLYTGDQVLGFGPGLWALPFAALRRERSEEPLADRRPRTHYRGGRLKSAVGVRAKPGTTVEANVSSPVAARCPDASYIST